MNKTHYITALATFCFISLQLKSDNIDKLRATNETISVNKTRQTKLLSTQPG